MPESKKPLSYSEFRKAMWAFVLRRITWEELMDEIKHGGAI